VSCVKPEGALYVFPRLDPEVYDIADDEQLVLDLLLQEKILVTQGTGFNWPAPDHLRIVTLPWSRDLAKAIGPCACVLMRGHVVTVEPGLYRSGYGGLRLEDLVLVTKDGHEVLTDYPYDLKP